MSETLHRKLSVLAAKTGRKKVDLSANAVGGWAQGGGGVGTHAFEIRANYNLDGAVERS